MNALLPEYSLPVGTRLRGGALLIEEVLRRDDKSFIYRAYDVPGRRQVELCEYFPPDASRHERTVVPPAGWSAQGYVIARQKFVDVFSESLFSFEEHGTFYVAQEYSPSATQRLQIDEYSSHATVALAPTPKPVPLAQPTSSVAAPQEVLSPATPVSARPQFSWRDVLPDALRGAGQGAIAGTVGGVLLGVIAAMVGGEEIIAGAMRGLWALPIGAVAGALLGVLRALPSNAPQLATASARTREEQIQSTLSGAGKGAMAGVLFSGVFLLGLIVMMGGGASLFSLIRVALLFALSGAFAGAIVGFIRVVPRDRSRR